jgi:hypothetical protein
LPSESDADDSTSSCGGSVADDFASAPTTGAVGGSSSSATSTVVADSDAAKAASASSSGLGLGGSGTLQSRLKGKSDAAKKVCALCQFVMYFVTVPFLLHLQFDSNVRLSKVFLVSSKQKYLCLILEHSDGVCQQHQFSRVPAL